MPNSGSPPGSDLGDTAIRDELAATLAAAVELHRKRHFEQAETLYRAILAVDPSHADALHLLGVLADQLGRHEIARDLIGRALRVNPGVAPYHFNHGVCLQALGDLVAAAAAYRSAVELEPRYRSALENLGVALQDSGDLGGARHAYERALEIAPDSVLAHQNLGTLLNNAGLTGEARSHFDATLDVSPANPEAHWKRALTLLAEGNFVEGWREYEWRHHAQSFVGRNPPRLFPFPNWDGSPLDGKKILIHREQGIGDEIMFASCYAEVVERATACVIEADPRLVELFARSFPRAAVVPARNAGCDWDESLPRFDFRVAAGSLPRFYRSRLDLFHIQSSYLRVDPVSCADWQRRLSALGPGLNVGIAWRGGTDARAKVARSIALDEWRPLLTVAGAKFINLQHGDHSSEIDDFHRGGSARLHTFEGLDALSNIDDFTALIAALDLVVSIDNSTVFMAGAIGTPVWVLLPSSAEWRWLQRRDTSPWFSSARLFRQAQPDMASWRSVLLEVSNALQQFETEPTAVATADAVTDESRRWIARRTLPPIEDRRALLINDTSNWYHWGCSCTSIAIHEQLREKWRSVRSLPIQQIRDLAPLPTTVDAFDDDESYHRFAGAHGALVAAIEEADIVYINGEGTLHNVGRDAVALLYIAYVAKQRLRKPVQLINHSAFPDDTATASDSAACALYRKVYASLDFVATREALSTKLLESLGIEPTQSFDCLPLFVERHWQSGRRRQRKRVVIAGSAAWGGNDDLSAFAEFVTSANRAGLEPTVLIGASSDLAGDDSRFAETLQRLAPRQFALINAASELEWLDAIASAAMLISGRFHHSIAAAFLDTPFAVMESNSPKIHGLLGMLGVDAFVSVSTAGLASALLEKAQEYVARSNERPLDTERKAYLLSLSRRNFAAAL